jgi:hypothetical protein
LPPLVLDLIRWGAYALLIASAIPAGMAVSQLVKSRRARYYVTRQNAFKRAKRWILAAFVLQALAVVLLVAGLYLPAIMPASPVTLTATPTVTPVFTPTPRPTRTPTVTPTRRPTATPPFIPTSTPAAPLPEPALSPLPSAVPAGEDARIAVITLAADRDDNDQPVDPGTEFPPGDHRVYLFFTYEGMKNGVTTTFAWYKDREFIDFCSDTWLWGLVEGRDWGERGRTSYYCNPPGGWKPGTYEIQVFIEDRLQGVAQFLITEG